MAAFPARRAVSTELFKPVLLRACGFSFEDGREKSLEEALHRRMQARGVVSEGDYLALLGVDPGEMRSLVELLTVNETYFLREPDALRLITTRLMPEILAARPGRAVRLLSAGCSTGEEPYSLAMLLADAFGPAASRLFSISGVDIDTGVIARARRGVFSKSSFRGVDPEFLSRHFDPVLTGGHRVKADIRDRVEFLSVNLLDGRFPPLMREQDVILYRNVSIYFPEGVRREVFSSLAGCLNEGGYLLVGAAETLQHDVGLLTLRELDNLYVFQKQAGRLAEKRLRGASCPLPTPGPGRSSPAPSGRRPDPPKAALPGRAVATVRGTSTLPGGASRLAIAPGPRSPEEAALPAGAGERTNTVREVPGAAATGTVDLAAALELAREGRIADALAEVRGLLARGPRDALALALEGSLLLAGHRLPEAAKSCRESLSLDPLCLEASLLLGMVAFQEGDNEEALKRFREAIYKNPSCWAAHFHMAEIMFGLGQRKRAAAGYETAARLLEVGGEAAAGRGVFPLAFNADQFLAVCRHKLALIRNG